MDVGAGQAIVIAVVVILVTAVAISWARASRKEPRSRPPFGVGRGPDASVGWWAWGGGIGGGGLDGGGDGGDGGGD